MLIDTALLDRVSAQAKASPRLRQNYDLRNTEGDLSQRMLNALEPGTVMPIHRHMLSSESVVLLRGSIRQNFYDVVDDSERTGGCRPVLTGSWVLKAGTDAMGCNIPKGQWHNLECLEPDTVLFESKDGPWEPLKDDDVIGLD